MLTVDEVISIEKKQLKKDPFYAKIEQYLPMNHSDLCYGYQKGDNIYYLSPINTTTNQIFLLSNCSEPFSIQQNCLKLYEHRLQSVAKYFILKSLNKLYSTMDCLTFMESLGLAKSKDLFYEIMRLHVIPEPILSYFQTKKCSFQQLKHLARFSIDTYNCISIILSSIPLSYRDTEICCEYIEMIVKREATKTNDILQMCNWKDIQSYSSINQQVQCLKQNLFEQTHPTLNEHNSDLKASIKKLNLPKNIDCKWDQSLENKGLHVTINLLSGDDFDSALFTLQKHKDSLVELIKKT